MAGVAEDTDAEKGPAEYARGEERSKAGAEIIEPHRL
jgi:hypothetical protein